MTKPTPTKNTTRFPPQQTRNSPDVAQAVCGVGSGDASNCIDKDFDCNYGLQVTFLAKNSITVRADEIEQNGDVASTKKGSYGKIQFVNEDPLSIDNLVAPQASSPESNVETTSTPLPLPLSPSPRGLLPGKENDRSSVPNSVSDGDTPIPRRIEERETSDTYRGARSHSQHHITLAPWELDSHAHAHLNHAPTPPVTLEPPIPPNTFSAKDEFAVQGLLALGTQSGPGPAPAPESGSGSDSSACIPDPMIAGADDYENREIGPVVDAEGTPDRAISVMSPGFVDGILQSTVGQGVSPAAAHSILNFDTGGSNVSSYSFPRQLSDYKSMPQTWKLQLLQNYRYHVAPWLDILDLSHSFGITALQLAFGSSSERLLHALLALSDTCLRARQGRGYSDAVIQLDSHFYSHAFQAVHYEDTAASYSDSLVNAAIDENLTKGALLRLLKKLGRLLADVARAWAMDRDQYEQDGRLHGYEYRSLQPLSDRAYGLGMDPAIYWMFLRIDLGTSLANNTPLRTLLPPHPLPSLSRLARTEDTHERVGHYAQVLLSLCGKALNIYHQQDAAPPLQGAGPDNWFQVFEKLSQWYYLRPQEFHPMVELNHEAGDALNAGKCKPRTATALLNQHQKLNPHSPVLSPLWHAHRGRVLGSVSAGILSCRG
ncbi:hypothetical protein BDW72DRAFT_200091 [Aspergillus terricola var. indicus]